LFIFNFNEMKKFIIHVCAFILFSCAFYITCLLVWGRFAPKTLKPNIRYLQGSYGHMSSRLSEVKNYNNIDILFVGSSHAYRGFDTRIFAKNGFRTFNLGSSSQTPIQTIVLLERYLKSLNPKTIVFEVYPELFMIDGVESSLDIIANDKNDFSSLKMAINLNNIKTYNTLIYGIFQDLLNSNQQFLENNIKGEDKYISGGFVEKEISYYSPTTYGQKDIILNKNQVDTFSKIISQIKSENIDLILVFAPVPRTNFKRFTNPSYFDGLMTTYSDYYNFNNFMTLNDSIHFYDSDHLNQIGVELFNNELIKILKGRETEQKYKNQRD
ncbi:MAG: hypothetical protein AAGH46_05615, partial [Bacteroidota bacterium]